MGGFLLLLAPFFALYIPPRQSRSRLSSKRLQISLPLLRCTQTPPRRVFKLLIVRLFSCTALLSSACGDCVDRIPRFSRLYDPFAFTFLSSSEPFSSRTQVRDEWSWSSVDGTEEGKIIMILMDKLLYFREMTFISLSRCFLPVHLVLGLIA